jgi:CYTH domain-containing protein
VIGKILTKNKKNRVYKKRYIYIDDGYVWEIDLIRKNEKLMILAELENQIYKNYSLPDFIKYEVTGLDIYSSKNLYKII